MSKYAGQSREMTPSLLAGEVEELLFTEKDRRVGNDLLKNPATPIPRRMVELATDGRSHQAEYFVRHAIARKVIDPDNKVIDPDNMDLESILSFIKE